MGFRSFIKKVGKGLKKALPYVAPVAALIPGVGSAISGAIGSIGGMFSSGSSAKQPPAAPALSQADVEAAQGWDYSGSSPTPTYSSPAVSVTAPKMPPPASAPPWWQQALGTLGEAAQTAIPAYLSYIGQQKANQANASAAQAQMDFQASQTGTSYQRAVADMKAAGLNPMLAYSQGGAASGTGASYQSGSELGAGVSSAFQARMQKQQIENLQSAIGVNDADIRLKGIYGETEATKQSLNEAHAESADASAARDRAEALRIAADIPGVNARSASAAVEAFVKDQTQKAAISHANSAAKYQEMHAQHEEVRKHLSSQQVPEAEVYSRYYRSNPIAQYDPHARSAGKWASAASDLSGALNPLAILKGLRGAIKP